MKSADPEKSTRTPKLYLPSYPPTRLPLAFHLRPASKGAPGFRLAVFGACSFGNKFRSPTPSITMVLLADAIAGFLQNIECWRKGITDD